jgi:hypothetical protein
MSVRPVLTPNISPPIFLQDAWVTVAWRAGNTKTVNITMGEKPKHVVNQITSVATCAEGEKVGVHLNVFVMPLSPTHTPTPKPPVPNTLPPPCKPHPTQLLPPPGAPQVHLVSDRPSGPRTCNITLVDKPKHAVNQITSVATCPEERRWVFLGTTSLPLSYTFPSLSLFIMFCVVHLPPSSFFDGNTRTVNF